MISAPVLWIFSPFILGGALFLLRRWPVLCASLGSLVALILAAMAWFFPVGQLVQVGPWLFRLWPLFGFMGRAFVVEDQTRGLVILIYLLAAVFFAAAIYARPGPLFVPLGFVVVGLLLCALTVTPFLYAALFLQASVLVLVPLLVPPGRGVGKGVLRFLTLQTLGAPFIWLLGWFLTDRLLVGEDAVRALTLVGFGFALLLGVFPFHTWIPMLLEEVHPLAAVFVFTLYTGTIALFGMSFINNYAFIAASQRAHTILAAVGVLMLLAGAVWASFENNLARILGFVVLGDIGWSLLALGLNQPEGRLLFFQLFIPRVFAYTLWAAALARIREVGESTNLGTAIGAGWRQPILFGGLLIGQFSLAGMPLLASFPVYYALLNALAVQNVLFYVSALLSLGACGLFGMRSVLVLFSRPITQVAPGGSWRDGVFAGVFGAIILVCGLAPGWYAPLINLLPAAFARLFS